VRSAEITSGTGRGKGQERGDEKMRVKLKRQSDLVRDNPEALVAGVEIWVMVQIAEYSHFL